MARIEDEPALILHTRHYRESSVLVDLLTAHHGRVAAVVKGARGPRASSRSRLQVFSTFAATWYGGRELVTLAMPTDLRGYWLRGDAATAGLYINELIVRLVREREPMPELFAMACWALAELASERPLAPVLRNFEALLLETLGYALNYASELDSGADIVEDVWYRLVDVQGFVSAGTAAPRPVGERGYALAGQQLLLRGDIIHRIGAQQFAQPAVAGAARQLFRRALAPLLGDRPLKSRELLNAQPRQQAAKPEHDA